MIGSAARYVDEADAAATTWPATRCTTTTPSASFQLERGGQWVKGKSCDTFAPLGPFLATADELADPPATWSCG